MQGQYPFNESAFKLGLIKGFQLGLLIAALFAAIVYGLIRDAHAETVAQQVFGQWQPKRIEQILEAVPEWEQPRTLPGAVSREERYKPDPDACPVRENGKTVGFRFNCPDSGRHSMNGGPLVSLASDS